MITTNSQQVKVLAKNLSSDMRAEIIDILQNGFDIDNVKLSYHLQDKIDNNMFDNEINNSMIEEIINNADKYIVEANITETYKKSIRVLLRGNKLYKRNKLKYGRQQYDNMCMVVDIFTKDIVTIYFNDSTDNHSKTFRNLQYNNNLENEIKEVIENEK